MKKKINIEGMSCMHCVMHVKNALLEVKGVKDVDVNLKEKYATLDVEGSVDSELKSAVEDAGYDVISIEEI